MRDIYLWTGPKDEAGRSKSGGDPDFEVPAGPRLIRPLPGSLVTDVGADALWWGGMGGAANYHLITHLGLPTCVANCGSAQVPSAR